MITGAGRLRVNRPALVAAAGLGLLALGLPWSRLPEIPGAVYPGVVVDYPTGNGLDLGVSYLPPFFFPTIPGSTVAGLQHPMRLLGLAAALLLWLAIRRGSRPLGWLALAVGTLAVPLGLQLSAMQSGRVCYLAALVCAAYAIGLIRRPHLRRS